MPSFWISLTVGVIASLVALGVVAVGTALEEQKNKQSIENKPVIIHMHTTLRIIINGERITIPKHVGIDPDLYNTHKLDRYGIKEPKTYPLHTHDTSGVIHIESTEIRTYTLGEFFDVWGKTFNKNCILDKCNQGLNRIRMYVDGVESLEFREHVLKDREVITIEYGIPKEQLQPLKILHVFSNLLYYCFILSAR